MQYYIPITERRRKQIKQFARSNYRHEQEFAEALGIHRNALSRIMSGEVSKIKPRNAELFESVMGIKI